MSVMYLFIHGLDGEAVTTDNLLNDDNKVRMDIAEISNKVILLFLIMF